MVRWCCYCQTFIGESEPLADFSLTHGICKGCKVRHKSASNDIDALAPVRKFFQKLQQSVNLSSIPDPQAILLESQSLKINPSDLLMGIIQPLLYQIGKLYEAGKITVSEEHQFSEFVSGLLHLMRQKPKPVSPRGAKDDVLLTCINSNYHSFGVRFLEQLLRDEGICATAIYPSLPIPDTLVLAEASGARVVGISICLDSQVSELRLISDSLKRWKSGAPPLIIVGGQSKIANTVSIDGVQFHNNNIKDFVSVVRNALGNDRGLKAS